MQGPIAWNVPEKYLKIIRSSSKKFFKIKKLRPHCNFIIRFKLINLTIYSSEIVHAEFRRKSVCNSLYRTNSANIQQISLFWTKSAEQSRNLLTHDESEF